MLSDCRQGAFQANDDHSRPNYSWLYLWNFRRDGLFRSFWRALDCHQQHFLALRSELFLFGKRLLAHKAQRKEIGDVTKAIRPWRLLEEIAKASVIDEAVINSNMLVSIVLSIYSIRKRFDPVGT